MMEKLFTDFTCKCYILSRDRNVFFRDKDDGRDVILFRALISSETRIGDLA